MKKESRHVAPRAGGGWSVRGTGAIKASKNFDTQADALAYGKALTQKYGADLYIHTKSGIVSDRVSYKT